MRRSSKARTAAHLRRLETRQNVRRRYAERTREPNQTAPPASLKEAADALHEAQTACLEAEREHASKQRKRVRLDQQAKRHGPNAVRKADAAVARSAAALKEAGKAKRQAEQHLRQACIAAGKGHLSTAELRKLVQQQKGI